MFSEASFSTSSFSTNAWKFDLVVIVVPTITVGNGGGPRVRPPVDLYEEIRKDDEEAIIACLLILAELELCH